MFRVKQIAKRGLKNQVQISKRLVTDMCLYIVSMTQNVPLYCMCGKMVAANFVFDSNIVQLFTKYNFNLLLWNILFGYSIVCCSQSL